MSSNEFDASRMMFSLFVVCSNLLAYATIYRLSHFQNTFGTLLKSHIMADFMFGLCCLVDSFRLIGKEHHNDLKMCTVLSYGLNIFMAMGIITFTFISWDRFYARTFPNSYNSVMSQQKLFALIWISYVLCAMFFLPSLRILKIDNPPKSCVTYWQDYSTISFLIIFLLMVGNLTITAVCCLLTLKKSVCVSTAKQSPHCSTCDCDFDKISGKVFLGITIMFYIMWFPFITVTFILIFTDALVSIRLINIFFNLGLATSILKLVIYVGWLPVFGDAFVESCSNFCNKCYDCMFPERIADILVTDRINNNIARFNRRFEPFEPGSTGWA